MFWEAYKREMKKYEALIAKKNQMSEEYNGILTDGRIRYLPETMRRCTGCMTWMRGQIPIL